MAGLLMGGAPKPGGQIPEANYGKAAPADGEQQGTNVSPEEQAIYDRFVDNGLKVIFSPSTYKSILGRIDDAKNPIEGLASVTVMVVETVRKSAEKNGQMIPEDVLLHGGMELLSNIADLARAGGVHDYNEDDIEAATYAALDQYASLEMTEGRIDKDAAIADFKALQEADRTGRIDDLIPGLSEHAKSINTKMKGSGGEMDPRGKAAPKRGGM